MVDREQITSEWKPVLIPGFVKLVKSDDVLPQHIYEVVIIDGKYVEIGPPSVLTDKITVYYGSFLCEAHKQFLAEVSQANEQRAIAHLKMIVTEDNEGLPAEARVETSDE